MARVYDLVLTHRLDADDLFIQRVQAHCAEAGLNFFLIEPLWAEAFLAAFQRDALWPRVLLNLHSEHHDPAELYHRIVRYADERGVQVIDPLAVALPAFDKAQLHDKLVAAGVPAPPSVVVTAKQLTDFHLTDEQRALLGSPFVIKPARGYGRRGVLLDATGEDDLARSAALWPDHAWLLQKRIEPLLLGGEPAYWRLYYVFGEVWCAWWNCFTDRYRMVTDSEWQALRLTPLEALVRRIAELTGMRFFSTEIAQTEDGQFVAIDYMNDQCHLLSQSSDPQKGVPDALVRAIARRLVEAVVGLIRK